MSSGGYAIYDFISGYARTSRQAFVGKVGFLYRYYGSFVIVC